MSLKLLKSGDSLFSDFFGFCGSAIVSSRNSKILEIEIFVPYFVQIAIQYDELISLSMSIVHVRQ